MFRLVIFDFDGTLVNSNAIKERALHSTVAGIRGGVAALKAARSVGGDRYQLFEEVARQLDRHGNPTETKRLGRALAFEYGKRCARGIVAAPERRGGRAALAELKRRGLRIYVNSSTPTADLRKLLRARAIAQYFDGVNGSSREKAANLRAIMRAEGVSPRQTVVVGDGEDDLAAAQKCLTWFVGITVERCFREKISHRVRDLTLLLPLLDRIASRPVVRRAQNRKKHKR